MTAIAGFTDGKIVYIAGDTLATDDSSGCERTDSKVFRVGPMVIGFAGSYRVGQLLRYGSDKYSLEVLDFPAKNAKKHTIMRWVVTNMVPAIRSILVDGGSMEKDNEADAPNVDMLVGIGPYLFSICSDLQVGMPHQKYAGCGAGEPYCIGAFHATRKYDMPPRDRVKMAVEAAASACLSVGGRINILETR